MGGEEESPKKEPEKPLGSVSQEKPPIQFREKVVPITLSSLEAAELLYDQFLNFVTREIFEKVKSEQPLIEGRKIQEAVEPVVERILNGGMELLYYATIRSTPDYYLNAHAVNTCLFSIFLGKGLGYSREALILLAIGALLHDVGMVKVMDVVQKKKRLDPEEKKAVEKHVQLNVDILKNVKGLPEKCLTLTQVVHERHNGQGYPLGLLGEDLSEEGQIVGLCDVYEALTHPRSYRDQLSPYEALKEILKDKDIFNPRLLKIFLQQLTIYPIGCWVELSTGEEGRVIMTSSDFPLRPTLRVICDRHKKKLSAPRMIDLSQHATLYIKRNLEGREVEGREKGDYSSGGR